MSAAAITSRASKLIAKATASPALVWRATFALGLAVVLFAQWGPDWPAQEFRAGLASHDGLLAWTDQWYAGQALPGYSVLYPALAGILGAAGTGLLAATAAAWVAGRLLPRTNAAAHRRYSAAVALLLVCNLLIGQIPFLLGTAFGLGALLALNQRRVAWTLALAAACSLSSPLAGAFLLLAVPALALHFGWRRAALLSSAVVGLVASAVIGGAGGPFPCPWLSTVGVLAFCAVCYAVSLPSDRLLRRFVLVYAVAGVLCFVVPNPVGGNITRLGKLVALPLACYLLTQERRRRLLRPAVMLVPALVWSLLPMTTAIAQGATDPSQHGAYYQGLLSFLKTQNPASGRLEIPFTREHWEAAWVAPSFPLARGWERQTDLRYDAVLYKPLTATSYRAWLDQNAVGLVALPDVPLDDGGKAEATLLAHPPAYLTPVWHDANWRVWRVEDAQPLASGAATVSEIGQASFRAHFNRAGTALVRIRSSNLWQVTDGNACLTPSPNGWLEVRSPAAGNVTVRARLNLQLVTGSAGCDDDSPVR